MPTAQEIAELKRNLIPTANNDDPESLRLLESGWTPRDLVQRCWKKRDWLFFLVEVDGVPDDQVMFLIPSCNKRVLQLGGKLNFGVFRIPSLMAYYELVCHNDPKWARNHPKVRKQTHIILRNVKGGPRHFISK